MKLLLDTNALIWLLEQFDQNSLGPQAIKIITRADVVYASPISIVEIRIKTMIGKLGSRPDLLADLAKTGCEVLEFGTSAADAIMQFPSLMRHDPFNRMLLAQANAENLTFMTADTILLGLGLPYVIDVRV